MLKYKETANTGWLQQCLTEDCLMPGDLYQSHNLTHLDQPNLDRDQYFIFCCVGVIEAFGRLWIYLSAAKTLV